MQVEWAGRREETSAQPRERRAPPQRQKRRAKDDNGDYDYGKGATGCPSVVASRKSGEGKPSIA